VIAVANDPIALGLLKGVWSGESYEHERLRRMKQMLDMLPLLPPELQEKLKAMPPELRAQIEALPPAPLARPDPAPLLRHLVAVGLATEEYTGPDGENPDVTCHELVRERIRAWMQDHPQDRSDLMENAIRLAYAERLESVFRSLQHQDMTTALEAGSRALVYYVQAEAYDRLSYFASDVVVSTGDQRRLASLLPHLEAAAESAPEGELRWSCLCSLADALWKAGRPDASLPFYEQAAAQARTAAEGGGENARRAWSVFAQISGNWAHALGEVSDLDASRQRFLDSAEAMKQADRPAIYVIACELESLRIDIQKGQVAQALPQVEMRQTQVEAWWQQHQTGQRVLDAPDPEFLARVVIGALDIANDAHRALGNWESALRCTETILAVQRSLHRPAEVIAVTRMNRGNELGALQRFAEAKTELEDCLQVFREDPTMTAKTLGSLAALFNDQGDVVQAIIQERRALAVREQLPDFEGRAKSHGKLATFLYRSDTLSALTEAPGHQLAALIYHLVAGLGQDLRTSLHNYAVRFRRVHTAGTTLTVPRVAELLADPAFRPLDDWLRQRKADVAEVQDAVDQLLEQVRQAAMEQEQTQEPSPPPQQP
jgi:tetratricopeptide (TPR) repeat protein